MAPAARAAAKQGAVTLVDTDARARELAAHVLDPGRTRPLVLLSTRPADRAHEPQLTLAEAEHITSEVGPVADVVVIVDGDSRATWVFQESVPEGWSVYGGAFRSYPVDIPRDLDLRRSPLHFNFDGNRRPRTQKVIADALGQASAAGLFAPAASATPAAKRAAGVVIGFTAGRALVQLDDDGMASVLPESIDPDLPLDWLVGKGSRVSGVYDPRTHWLHLDAVPIDADALRAAYPHGAVTLALVSSVSRDTAELLLTPGATGRITVTRADVSLNDLDTVDLLLSRGDVVAARVVHLSHGGLHLRLNDIDDDEPTLPAHALIAGGLPWLRAGRSVPSRVVDIDESSDADATAGLPREESVSALIEAVLDDAEPATAPTAASPAARPAPPVPPRPAPQHREPALGSHPVPGPGRHHVEAAAQVAAPAASTTASAPAPAVSSSAAVQSAHAALAMERAQHAGLRRLADRATELEQHNRMLRAEVLDLKRELGHAQDRLRTSREALRARASAKSTRPTRPTQTEPKTDPRDAWPTLDEWVREEIRRAWVKRVAAADKRQLPLPASYRLGPGFAASVDALDARLFGKAMRAAVDVLTGQAKRMPGRETHRLRSGTGGDDPVRVRASDEATAMRCAVEIGAPSARRLHWWVLPDGRVELAKIVTHDDFSI